MASVGDGNGGKIPVHFERRDKLFLGISGLLMTMVMGGFVPLSLYIFQTRSDAAVETAARIARETEIETSAALHEQEVQLRRIYDEREMANDRNAVRENKALLRTLNANQRTLMDELDVPKSSIRRMPAGISFDDITDLTNPKER